MSTALPACLPPCRAGAGAAEPAPPGGPGPVCLQPRCASRACWHVGLRGSPPNRPPLQTATRLQAPHAHTHSTVGLPPRSSSLQATTPITRPRHPPTCHPPTPLGPPCSRLRLPPARAAAVQPGAGFVWCVGVGGGARLSVPRGGQQAVPGVEVWRVLCYMSVVVVGMAVCLYCVSIQGVRAGLGLPLPACSLSWCPPQLSCATAATRQLAPGSLARPPPCAGGGPPHQRHRARPAPRCQRCRGVRRGDAARSGAAQQE